MAKVLTSNGVIRDLNLSYNRIAGKGTNFIAKSLAVNGTLNVLKLSGNSLVSEDAVALLDSISKNSSTKLRHLYLGEVTVSTEVRELFQNILHTNPTFLVSGMVGAVGQPIRMTSTNTAIEALEDYFAKNKLNPIINLLD